MKKIILSLLFIIGVLSSEAQHYFGLKNAYAITNIDSKMRTGPLSSTFNPGVIYQYKHKKYFAIQLEFNYIQKGYEEKNEIKETPNLDEYNMNMESILVTEPLRINHKINSLELPLMAQGFIQIGPVRPYVTAGATLGYILSRATEEKGVSVDYVFGEYDRRLEYGIAGGAGMGVRVNRFELQMEWRYHYNFSFLKNPMIEGRIPDYLNSVQMIMSIGLMYRFGK